MNPITDHIVSQANHREYEANYVQTPNFIQTRTQGVVTIVSFLSMLALSATFLTQLF